MSKAWFFLLSTCLAGVACGGPQSGPREPGRESESPSEHGDGEGSEGSGAGEDASTHAAPPAPRCDDGTCILCGDALCPSGWYCDETAPSGAACGWLPECAEQASCSCVKRAFKGCECEDEPGGARLTCG
jgi:hypothetical protein